VAAQAGVIESTVIITIPSAITIPGTGIAIIAADLASAVEFEVPTIWRHTRIGTSNPKTALEL
jgi:hypothetical protein